VSDLKKFGAALVDLFVEGKLPADDVPLTDLTPPEVIHAPASAEERRAPYCPRCRGMGECVVAAGIIGPCDEPGCPFRKRGA
jgi:hypothetical protein